MGRSQNPKNFLTADESLSVETAIAKAEENTSAEIKLVIARHCWTNIKTKAEAVFKKNDLGKTQQRNCVLILLVVANREFLVYGDKAIHQKVGQDFWDDVRNTMSDKFKQDAFGQGLADGVRHIGEKLTQYFPPTQNDTNEISNEVTYED